MMSYRLRACCADKLSIYSMSRVGCDTASATKVAVSQALCTAFRYDGWLILYLMMSGCFRSHYSNCKGGWPTSNSLAYCTLVEPHIRMRVGVTV